MFPRLAFAKMTYLLVFLGAVSILTPSCEAIRRSQQSIPKHGTPKSPKKKEVNAYRASIIDSAKKQLGIKYKFGGSTPKTGFDCSGFTKYVYEERGVTLPRVSKEQAKAGRRVNLKYVKTGDLIFFGKGRKVSHVAIVTENKKGGIYVIHSTTSKGVNIDNISTSNYWKPRILFARNVLGSGVIARKQ